MKKKQVKLNGLKFQKQVIATLGQNDISGGAPVRTLIDRTCFQTCQATCTLDGTIASRYVSNCCPIGHAEPA